MPCRASRGRGSPTTVVGPWSVGPLDAQALLSVPVQDARQGLGELHELVDEEAPGDEREQTGFHDFFSLVGFSIMTNVNHAKQRCLVGRAPSGNYIRVVW